MNSTIIAAVIGGVFTVVGPIATFIITRYFDNRDKQVMSLNRQALLTGKWRGIAKQESGLLVNLPVTTNFVAKRKIIDGQFRIQYPEIGNMLPHEDAEFKFQGGFLHDRLLQLDYISKDERRVQFGSIILELHPNGDVLSGRYVGYGAFAKQIVSGSIELRRTA